MFSINTHEDLLREVDTLMHGKKSEDPYFQFDQISIIYLEIEKPLFVWVSIVMDGLCHLIYVEIIKYVN